MADLFGDQDVIVAARHKGNGRKPPGPPSADVKAVIDAYHDAFVRRFGFKPRISGGKDGALVKQLLAAWGRADVLALVDEFFTTTEPRVMRSDYTVGALATCAQAMKLRGHRVDDRTARNLDAAVRASQPRRRS